LLFQSAWFTQILSLQSENPVPQNLGFQISTCTAYDAAKRDFVKLEGVTLGAGAGAAVGLCTLNQVDP
jgi:hypothetical protein